MKPVILIADDHALIRKGLREVLENTNMFEISEASDGREALALILNRSPEVAILDVDMPGLTGVQIAMQVKEQDLPTDIIFLTMHRDEQIFNKAIDLGVKGYVLKENTVSEIVECIQQVRAGKNYVSPTLAGYLIQRSREKNHQQEHSDSLSDLTSTEKLVLRKVSEMKTNAEIADDMGVSIKTIQNHRSNICTKLGIHGAHALLKFSVENKDLLT